MTPRVPAVPPADEVSPLDMRLQRKLDELSSLLGGLGSVLVAFSGGVDSSLLARVAHEALGDRAVACIAVSPTLASDELAAAEDVARAIGIRLVRIETHELEHDEYARNPVNRCYVCKGVLFEEMARVASDEQIGTIAYGENADDAGDYRPGTRAAVEAGIRAPLAEVGLTKADVRAAALALGLSTWDKPAAPCLATRIPYGDRVTVEKLSQVELAERVVRGLGFRESRVRHHGEIARVEIAVEELWRAVEPAVRETIVRELRAIGFRHVTLDLVGYRSGSLGEGLVARPALVRSPLPVFVTLPSRPEAGDREEHREAPHG